MESVRKNSIKRSAILEALISSKEHPSADMIYDQLKKQYKDLSLGTVYRNLSMFCNDGNAKVVATVDGKERYDGDISPHSHFICRGCGRIFDTDISFDPGKFLDEISSRCGWLIEDAGFSMSGLCSECCGSAGRNTALSCGE